MVCGLIRIVYKNNRKLYIVEVDFLSEFIVGVEVFLCLFIGLFYMVSCEILFLIKSWRSFIWFLCWIKYFWIEEVLGMRKVGVWLVIEEV